MHREDQLIKRGREILGMSRCGAIFRINIVGYFLVLLVEYWKGGRGELISCRDGI